MPRRNSPYRPSNTLSPGKKTAYWRLIIFLLILAAIISLPLFWVNRQNGEQNGAAGSQRSESSFDTSQFSLDDPASPWVIVNKKRPLNPQTYAPAGLTAPSVPLKGSETAESMQLRPEAARALEALVAAANAEGHELRLVSAYRSYDTQETIYDSEVRGFGQAVADMESARPGHSEHQTGWAADVAGPGGECEIEECFGDTPEGQWVAANAYKYGFVLRYPQGKSDITGYIYEPWHLRYVGTELSEELHRTNTQTLEKFFGLPAAPTY